MLQIFENWQTLITEQIVEARRLGKYSDSIVTIGEREKNTVTHDELLLTKNGAELQYVKCVLRCC